MFFTTRLTKPTENIRRCQGLYPSSALSKQTLTQWPMVNFHPTTSSILCVHTYAHTHTPVQCFHTQHTNNKHQGQINKPFVGLPSRSVEVKCSTHWVLSELPRLGPFLCHAAKHAWSSSSINAFSTVYFPIEHSNKHGIPAIWKGDPRLLTQRIPVPFALTRALAGPWSQSCSLSTPHYWSVGGVGVAVTLAQVPHEAGRPQRALCSHGAWQKELPPTKNYKSLPLGHAVTQLPLQCRIVTPNRWLYINCKPSEAWFF